MESIYSVDWKIKQSISPLYSDGYLAIKEDTPTEFPLAIVPYPVGGHRAGILRQQQRARLIAAAPELLRALEGLVARFDYSDQPIYSFARKEMDAAKAVIGKVKEGEL